MSRGSRRGGERAAERSPSPKTDSTKAGAAATAAAPAAGRRWLFRVVVALLPFALLLALELLLRVVGYGVSTDFVLRQEVDGETRYLSNPRFTWRFFDPAVARIPPPFSLAPHKPANTVRVFVLGSSAAQGDPEPAFGLARMLEMFLRDAYPGVGFEVVNAATTAVNSHYVHAAGQACLRLEPDVFVVYAGNNEVVGPYGAGAGSTAAAPPLPLVRAQVAAQGTRVGQLVSRLVRAAARGLGGGRGLGAWHGMEMFLGQQLRRSDPALLRAYRNYEGNLVDTCRSARGAGVSVVLSTVAVNLRNCGPFASLHGAALTSSERTRIDALVAEAQRLEAAGRWEDAAVVLTEAGRADPEYAETFYRLGRCETHTGHEADARRHLDLARDLDALRFRADSSTNRIVREIARREAGVRLADAEERLAAQSAHGIPGDEAFLDHVHLTFHGNYLVGSALFDQVRDALPEWVHKLGSGRPAPSEEEAARRLAYTELDLYLIAETMQQRLRDAPFTGQSDHAEQAQRLAAKLAALRARGGASVVDAVLQQYEQALAGPLSHWSLRERRATIEKRLGNPSAAAGEWAALTRLFPQYPGFQLQLARALRDGGQLDDAQAALQQVLDYYPDAPVTLIEMAHLALAQGRIAEATQAARRAVALDPRDANGLNVLAASLCPRYQCAAKERAEALGYLTRAAEIAPESDAVRRALEALKH